MSLSTRLQELRKKENLSQEQLAEKLDISRQAVSKWESEQSNPDINNIILLSEIFNVSTDFLLKGQDSYQNNPTIKKLDHKLNLSNVINILLIIFASISSLGLLYYIILFLNIKVLG